MNKSKTLIMIPLYNGEKYIARTIDSCLNQTLQTEIWIVDNCSTDQSQDIVQAYTLQNPNVKLFVNDKNCGRVGNWNRCLELFENSEFEYMKFLFVGDELSQNCIEEVESVFESEENLSIVLWPYIFKDLNGLERIVSKFDKTFTITKEYLIENNYFPFGKGIPGAIVCYTMAKKAIYGLRFNTEHLGLISFSNQLINKGNLYHINQPLSTFNLDGHSSYHKQSNYLNDLEVAFTRSMGLENEKKSISEEKYTEIKLDIVKDCIVSLSKHESKIEDFILFYADYIQNKRSI